MTTYYFDGRPLSDEEAQEMIASMVDDLAELHRRHEEIDPDIKYRREREERLREMIREEIAITLGNKPKHRDDPTFDPRYDYEYYPEDERRANEEWLRLLVEGYRDEKLV